MEAAECARWRPKIPSAELEIDLLGQSRTHHSEINATCRGLTARHNLSSLDLSFAENMDAFHHLSTFHATIHLARFGAEEKGCLQAYITPAFSPAVRTALRYAPLGILLFVLLVGVARSIPVSGESSPQSVLPGVADCLHYLQFVFLTGSLSLFYPGFYQPAVGRLGWVSLLAGGFVNHGHPYAGVSGGIYELNGTYGGTLGLELMTQIVGAPPTMDTWMNMVILIAIITIASALFLEMYRRLAQSADPDMDSDTQEPAPAGLRHTFYRTLRLILSYFMMPLVALSFYQINYATQLPAYHISLAALVVAANIIALIWLLSHVPTRSLGVLIFDNSKRYSQLSTSETGKKQDKRFILTLFTLTFIRGAAIGGLQIWGPAQLAVLGACDVVLLACAVQFQAYRGSSPDQPPVYGLRDLRRRPASRTDLLGSSAFHPKPYDPYGHDSAIYPEPYSTCLPKSDSISTSGRHYYRPPRHSHVCSHRSGDTLRDLSRMRSTATSPAISSRQPSASRRSESDDLVRGLAESSDSSSRTTKSSESTGPHEWNHGSDITSSAALAAVGTPLGPRWGDYSFREVDLYYCAPNPAVAKGNPSGASAPPPSRAHVRSSSPFNLWARVSGQPSTAERGFSVVRSASNPPPSQFQGPKQGH
ncbi:hypothetical protein DL762_007968 [Monosporascus cannonballus]|uniref:TRP C-terminal domain-containing protein n=1 Tax=Monosporascus cannonballus TaxID=155416 RepID=A0ABY0GY60_9PEZI|nr:hypothetical protein DL762_007968 [Monosporascus cannonballus]